MIYISILPKKYSNSELTYNQLLFLTKRLPEPHADTGRRPYTNLELLPGILFILRSGSRWRDLDRFRRFKDDPSGITHWRRLRYWRKSKAFANLWNYLLKGLSLSEKLDLKLISLDGSLIPSYEFKEKTGYSGKHHLTGTKISSLVDHNGLPLALTLASGERNDMLLAELTLENTHISVRGSWKEAKKGNTTLLADKGYDSKPFKYFLYHQGIKANIPEREFKRKHKRNYVPINSDYDQNVGKQRFVVERTNAWIKSFKRLKFRFDRSILSFEAFLYLGIMVILVRRLII